MKKQLNPKRWGLTLSLMAFVFGVVTAAMTGAGTLVFTLQKLGLVDFMHRAAYQEQFEKTNGFLALLSPLSGITVFSVVLALALTWFFGRRALDPIRKVIDATRQVAAGDFSARVHLQGVGELQELAQSFNKMAQELASIETLRSDFVNDFSHEFKTPIVSIQGFAELLQAGDLSEAERQEYAAIIVAESKRLAALSTNILTLSKYENTEIIAEKAEIALDEQIRRAIALVAPRAETRQLELVVELEEITFTGNEDLMQQIWLNLLDNAIKFSPPGGTIAIRLERAGKRVRFSITDEGPGMDAATQARIFDKFYQGDASRATAGSGLGLAIVKRIAELHGGTVAVQSAVGQGCAFLVEL